MSVSHTKFDEPTMGPKKEYLMKEKYYRVKGMYKDYIVFVKSGNFWNAYYGDALIVHYVTKYLFKNYKVGFPNKVLNSVLSKINSLNINYVLVYELDNIVKCEYISNSYTFYLDKFNVYRLEKQLINTVEKILC